MGSARRPTGTASLVTWIEANYVSPPEGAPVDRPDGSLSLSNVGTVTPAGRARPTEPPSRSRGAAGKCSVGAVFGPARPCPLPVLLRAYRGVTPSLRGAP